MSTIETWQDIEDNLSDDREFVSQGSERTYSGEDVKDRLRKVKDELQDGEELQDAVGWIPRIDGFNRGNLRREVFGLFQDEWYDIATDDEYFDDRGFRDHESTRQADTPYQGWKIHISADPEEARDIVRVVNEYSQEYSDTGLPHKFIRDRETMDSFGEEQSKKLVTVYPEVDDYKKENVMDRGRQKFKADSENFNHASVNSNKQTTEEVIEELAERLEEEGLLYGGPEIEGHNGEEIRLGNTRLHMRYGPFADEYHKKMEGYDGEEDTDTVIDQSGLSAARDMEISPKYVPPSDIEGVERPEVKI